METTRKPRILPKRLIESCWRIAIFSGLLFIAGNFLSYRNMRDTLLEEVRARSLALVQQHVPVAAHSLRLNDSALLTQTSELLLTQQGVRYLVITDAENRPIFSKSVFSEGNFTLPEEFRHPLCSDDNISMKNGALFGEAILRVDADIRSGKQLSDCAGVMYLGMSLKNADRSLLPLLAISIGFSVMLFGGIIASLAIFSRQTADFMQQVAHALLVMIPGNLHQNQPSIPTLPEETIVENAVRQLTAHRVQVRERFHSMSSQIHQAVNDLAKIVDTHAGSGHHHASLTLQSSLLTGERLKTFSQQSSDAQQMNEMAASALLSMRAIDSNVERFATGLDEMRESVESNMERVKTLNDKIRKIRNAVKTITSIADLTKLIAFNASIEAAGAGKSGGRFSIVATEVRRLANTVVNSVEEIEALVSSIETAAADLQLSSETGHHKVTHEQTVMFELRGLLKQTEELLQQTSTSAQGLFSSMQNSSEGNEQLEADMQTLTEEAEQIAHDHLRLLEAVKELAALIAECDADVQESA